MATSAMAVNIYGQIFLSFLFFGYCLAETYTVDEKLGVAYEFKVHVDPGKEECFFQNVMEGATLYIAFQVMRGGDNAAGFAIKNPFGAIVLPYEWKTNAEYEEQHVRHAGFYQLCIDNSMSRFAAKLVSLYVNSFKKEAWEKYVKDLDQLEGSVENFTSTLGNVDMRINDMVKYQEHSRQQMAKDWYLLRSNNKYVQWWSVVQCIVVVISSGVQVLFVRKLFDVKTRTPTAKPRA